MSSWASPFQLLHCPSIDKSTVVLGSFLCLLQHLYPQPLVTCIIRFCASFPPMLFNKGKSSKQKKSGQCPISAMYYQRTTIQHPSRIVLFKYNSGPTPAPGSSPTTTRLLGDRNRFNRSSHFAHIFCSNAHGCAQ